MANKTTTDGANTTAGAAGETVHCYRLIFQVDPGGSRKAESFVAGTLEEAKAAALADLGTGMGAYHAAVYGEEIVLQCWEGSKKLATVDLHPYIQYKIGKLKPLRFAAGEDVLIDMDDEENEALIDAMCSEEAKIVVTIDWADIELPALGGRPLRTGETIVLEGGKKWKHGYHEHADAKIRW